MKNIWIGAIMVFAVFMLTEQTFAQAGCGCNNNQGAPCQGYSQQRAEGLWANYCGEPCWGTPRYGHHRGWSRNCNTGCFAWPSNCCGAAANDCGQVAGCGGCGIKNLFGGLFQRRHGCGCGGFLHNHNRSIYRGGYVVDDCGPTCGTDCGCRHGLLHGLGHHGCLSKLRGMFNRCGYGSCFDSCGDTCDSCGANAGDCGCGAAAPTAQTPANFPTITPAVEPQSSPEPALGAPHGG